MKTSEGCYICPFCVPLILIVISFCKIMGQTSVNKWFTSEDSKGNCCCEILLPVFVYVWYYMLQDLKYQDFIAGPDEEVPGAVKANGVKEGLVSNGI